ncbi:semaphorin-6A-like [Oscarella lobularis]|uniref:semaphorin-6A-like n=1 Tax=Oscarella lobularis TaxID=121494 RepID=UPI003313DF3F
MKSSTLVFLISSLTVAALSPAALATMTRSIAIANPARILVAGERLIVASKDALRAFKVETFHEGKPQQTVNISSNRGTMCQIEGSPEECYNFPKVLSIPPNRTDTLLFCGTNALLPRCQYRSLSNLSNVLLSAEATREFSYCPYEKDQSNAFAFTDRGDHCYGATFLKRNNDKAWFKVKNLGEQYVRTMNKDSHIKPDADFVKIFEDTDHVYLAFREKGKEVDQMVISRLARVCKNDTGTGNNAIVSRDSFLSFLKTRLTCTTSSGYTYNELVSFSDAYVIGNETVFLGIFNNKENGPPASAVCLYKLKDIHSIFTTGLKHDIVSSKSRDNAPSCATLPPELEALNFNLVDPLPQSGQPLEVTYMNSVLGKYNTMFVLRDVTYNGSDCVMLFIGTDGGKLWRAVVCKTIFQTLNEIDIDASGPIQAITAYEPEDKFKTQIFVLSQSKVTSFPVYGCDHSEQSSCVSDFLCGWNCDTRTCARRPKACTKSSCDLKITLTPCPGLKTDSPVETRDPNNNVENPTGEPHVEPTLDLTLGGVHGNKDDSAKKYSVSVIIGVGIGVGIGAFIIAFLLGLVAYRTYNKNNKFASDIASGGEVIMTTKINLTPTTNRRGSITKGPSFDKQDSGIDQDQDSGYSNAKALKA